VVILKDHSGWLELGHNRLVTPIAVIIEMSKARHDMLRINPNLFIALAKRSLKGAFM